MHPSTLQSQNTGMDPNTHRPTTAHNTMLLPLRPPTNTRSNSPRRKRIRHSSTMLILHRRNNSRRRTRLRRRTTRRSPPATTHTTIHRPRHLLHTRNTHPLRNTKHRSLTHTPWPSLEPMNPKPSRLRALRHRNSRAKSQFPSPAKPEGPRLLLPSNRCPNRNTRRLLILIPTLSQTKSMYQRTSITLARTLAIRPSGYSTTTILKGDEMTLFSLLHSHTINQAYTRDSRCMILDAIPLGDYSFGEGGTVFILEHFLGIFFFFLGLLFNIIFYINGLHISSGSACV
jgi:hypothetical protein